MEIMCMEQLLINSEHVQKKKETKSTGLEFNYESKPPASQHDFRYCIPHMTQVHVRSLCGPTRN